MERHESLAAVVERAGPYAGGVITLVVALTQRAHVESVFDASGMNSKDVAGAAFNVMVMLTAFLFSVFVLAIAPGQGFLQKIMATRTFAIFRRYVIEALVVGCAAALVALPFMTTRSGSGVWNYWWAVSFWSALLATASLSFLRVAHIFLAWVNFPVAKNSRNGP